MVQLLKYKSLTITPEKQMVVAEFHGKISNRDLAKKVGVNYSTLKNYLCKMNFPSRYRERKEVPWGDQPTRLVISGIKNKYYTQALLAATEAVKQFKK